MLRKLNRKIQDYMRPKRLAIGKWIWDRKEKVEIENIDMVKVNSILFLRYDGKIGDMVVSTILFREVKKNYPHIKIGVVTRGAASDIIKNNPYVDDIYDYKKGKERELGKKIASEQYDILIDFSEMLRVNDMKLINLCNAKINIGLDKKEWNLFDISIELKGTINEKKHISERYGEYLKILSINKINFDYEIFTDDEAEKKIKNWYNKVNIEKKYIAILNPYGASKYRSLNEEKIIEIANILEKENYIVVPIYSPDKKEELRKTIKKIKLKNILFKEDINSVLDSSLLIKYSDLVISPDTSIIHIARAFDKKIIGIYRQEKAGENNFVIWGPKTEKAKIIFSKNNNRVGEESNINCFDMEDLKYKLKAF
ncbi:MAG: glycosyltransferase family 9 protein [Fusobacteriaceae bacterium]